MSDVKVINSLLSLTLFLSQIPPSSYTGGPAGFPAATSAPCLSYLSGAHMVQQVVGWTGCGLFF